MLPVVGLSVVMVALPLARGGVDWRVQLAAAAALPVLLWLCLRHEVELPLAGLLLFAVLAVTGLQLVPVSSSWHDIAPATRRLFEATLVPLGRYPAALPFSLDPASTGRELAKAVAGLSAFLIGWVAGHGRRRRSILMVALAAAGLLVAAAALGAALFRVSPVVAPSFPFVNPNHLAASLNLGAFAILGVALGAHGPARRLWLLGFVLVVCVLGLSLSRAGIAAFAVGFAVFLGLGLRRGTDDTGSGGRTLLSLGITLALAGAVVAYLALPRVFAELATLRTAKEETKVALWAPALRMAGERPWTGIGRGAFEATFAAYNADGGQVTFTHLENEWIQPLVELGIPAGLLLVGTLSATWLGGAWRARRGWKEVGLLAGVVAVATHSLFDFSLELLGVAVPFMVALGLVTAGGRVVRCGRWGPRLTALALLGCSLGGFGAWYAQRPDRALRAITSAKDSAEAVSAATQAVVYRPADFLPHAVVGVRLQEEDRCSEAMPWLNRAMLLNPMAPQPHLSAARCLAAAGQGTAAQREFRLAISLGRRDALVEALDWFTDLEDLLRVAPDAPEDLMALGQILERERPQDAATVYRRLLDTFADDKALTPLARATKAAGDLDGALALARQRTAAVPGDALAWRVAAEVLFELDDAPAADQAIRDGLAASPGSPVLLRLLYDRALGARKFSEARKHAEAILARSPWELATKELLIARALATQGRLPEAIERTETAIGLAPGSTTPLLALASYCEAAGLFDRAIAAVEHAATLDGGGRAVFLDLLERLQRGKREQADEERRRAAPR